MIKRPNRIFSSHEGFHGRNKSVHDVRRASTVIEQELLSQKYTRNCSTDSDRKSREEKLDLKQFFSENEIYRTFQASLLSLSVLLLSYQGIRHGRTEYSILENGRVVHGYVHKAVITLSFGYSTAYSLISVMATGMLIYSLISKRPRWSLPSIILYLADLVCDVSDAFVAVWLFFTSFSLSTAIFYTSGTVLLILGEIWVWLGVVRLYEFRSFK